MCVVMRATPGLDVTGDAPRQCRGGRSWGRRSEMAMLGWPWDSQPSQARHTLLGTRMSTFGTRLLVACRPRCQGCPALDPQVSPANPHCRGKHGNHIISQHMCRLDTEGDFRATELVSLPTGPSGRRAPSAVPGWFCLLPSAGRMEDVSSVGRMARNRLLLPSISPQTKMLCSSHVWEADS